MLARQRASTRRPGCDPKRLHAFLIVRSVAVNSVAGWMLGLGDRHSTNILLDLRSAAVVHIDLGVAFDQAWAHGRMGDGDAA